MFIESMHCLFGPNESEHQIEEDHFEFPRLFSLEAINILYLEVAARI